MARKPAQLYPRRQPGAAKRLPAIAEAFDRDVKTLGLQMGMRLAHGRMVDAGFTHAEAVDFLAAAILEAHRPVGAGAGQGGH